ncbi:hypothetical protein M127_5450 [Bacteroides fragilis str. S6L5]|nr:hypothetical protein M127_5450 [Bacteroides fragilis str. S6L5]
MNFLYLCMLFTEIFTCTHNPADLLKASYNLRLYLSAATYFFTTLLFSI